MLLIPCPWCGPRDEAEFHYGGQAHVPYPETPSALTDAQWARYLFFRANPKGPFAERWMHDAGCRRWFNAVRDTSTNEFVNQVRPNPARSHSAPPAFDAPGSGGSVPGGVRGGAPVSGRGGVENNQPFRLPTGGRITR